MIEIWFALLLSVVGFIGWLWLGYRLGRKDERLWWTRAADSDYHMVNIGDDHYTVLRTNEFVDKYHNPLARYRRGDALDPLSNVRRIFPSG